MKFVPLGCKQLITPMRHSMRHSPASLPASKFLHPRAFTTSPSLPAASPRQRRRRRKGEKEGLAKPAHKNDKPLNNLEIAQRICGYHFADQAILHEALQDATRQIQIVDGRVVRGGNQRLARIGDLIISLCIELKCYKNNNSVNESQVYREHYANNKRLAMICDQVGLTSTVTRFTPDKIIVKPTALEAVVGAVYLDGGLDAAKAVMGRLNIFDADHEKESDSKVDSKVAGSKKEFVSILATNKKIVTTTVKQEETLVEARNVSNVQNNR